MFNSLLRDTRKLCLCINDVGREVNYNIM